MKRVIYILAVVFLVFVGCQPKQPEQQESILPSSFTVEVPSTLESDKAPQSKVTTDTLDGSQLYEYLRYFIHVGKNASDIVQQIIDAIHKYNLSQNVSFSYTGNDGSVKNVVVKSNMGYDGQKWQYGMQITDADMESGDDHGIAMQVFWNLNPVAGVAVIKPSYMDKVTYKNWGDAMIKVYYSEAEPNLYDKYMIVSAINLPMSSSDKYAVKNLKMFVGKKSTRTDVYGNTEHPNAWILLPDHKGYDWAFVASAFPSEEIAVAQVGLPPDTLDETQRNVLLEDYSLYNVLKQEIKGWFFQQYGFYPDSATLANYLVNAKAPAHFTSRGFVPSQLAVNPMFKDLEDFIKNLCPYNPYDIAQMKISFGDFTQEQ